MNHDLIVPEVIETEPGNIMPAALVELDFDYEGQPIPPARMEEGSSCCSSSSCILPPKPN